MKIGEQDTTAATRDEAGKRTRARGPGGLHEDFDRSEVRSSSDRGFGLVFAAVFAIIGLWPVLDLAGVRWWALAIAAGFAATALLRPSLLAPLNRVWTAFGLLLHRIVNPLVMGVIFVTTIIPIGLVLRLRGHDPLRLRRDPAANTYWIVREPPGPTPETMKNQF